METSGRRIFQILIKGVTGSSKEVLVAWGEPFSLATLATSGSKLRTTSHPAHITHEQINLGKREKIAKFTCNSPALNLAIGTAAFVKANSNSCKVKASSPFLEKERENRRTRDEGGEKDTEKWM